VQTLGVVHEAGEDDHAEDKEEHKECQFLRARLEGVDEDLQTGGMASELEQPENPDD
jgi:hypothetical protein